MGKTLSSPGLGELLRVCSPGREAPAGRPEPGLCWETPLSAEGEVLETKRLKTNGEKQRKQHDESPREREMEG